MSYEVLILRRAQRELVRLPQEAYQRVGDVIRNFSGEPRPVGCLKLAGREGWRVRVGEYRIVYEIDDTEQRVIVLHVGHRRDVYR